MVGAHLRGDTRGCACSHIQGEAGRAGMQPGMTSLKVAGQAGCREAGPTGSWWLALTSAIPHGSPSPPPHHAGMAALAVLHPALAQGGAPARHSERGMQLERQWCSVADEQLARHKLETLPSWPLRLPTLPPPTVHSPVWAGVVDAARLSLCIPAIPERCQRRARVRRAEGAWHAAGCLQPAAQLGDEEGHQKLCPDSQALHHPVAS